MLKTCKKKIKKMYGLFFNDASFEKFAIDDLQRRGLKTIEAVRADEDLDLDELKVATLSTKFKGKDHVTDPLAVSFLVTQMIKMGKLSMKDSSASLITLYEIFLGMAILFGTDLVAKVPSAMLQICTDIVEMAQ